MNHEKHSHIHTTELNETRQTQLQSQLPPWIKLGGKCVDCWGKLVGFERRELVGTSHFSQQEAKVQSITELY